MCERLATRDSDISSVNRMCDLAGNSATRRYDSRHAHCAGGDPEKCRKAHELLSPSTAFRVHALRISWSNLQLSNSHETEDTELFNADTAHRRLELDQRMIRPFRLWNAILPQHDNAIQACHGLRNRSEIAVSPTAQCRESQRNRTREPAVARRGRRRSARRPFLGSLPITEGSQLWIARIATTGKKRLS